jgi:DNA-directed RNA polymerase II subunit RPB1
MLCLRGVGFGEVLATRGLVAERTTTNDVVAVMSTLGIEAATRVLFDEINATLANDYICHRHVLLLCSTMTHMGYLMPMSRHGLNRISDNGPMARCSFEECVEQIFDAAMYGEVDAVNDVTSRIMVGRRALVGTGMCHVAGRGDDAVPTLSETDDLVYTCGPDSDDEPPPLALPREELAPPIAEPTRKRPRSFSPSSPSKGEAARA